MHAFQLKRSANKALLGALSGAVLTLSGLQVRAAECEHVEPVWIAKQQGDDTRAVKLATQLIKSGAAKGPCLAKAHALRGKAYADLRQDQLANTDFAQSITLLDAEIKSDKLAGEPLAQALHTRALAHNFLGRKAEAIADYTAAIKAWPKISKSYVNRGNIYRRLRRYELALADYNSAFEVGVESDWAYRNRADTLRHLGRYEEAIADADKAIALDAAGHNRWYDLALRGDAHLLNGDYAKAIADYEQSLALNPHYQQAKEKIAKAREAMKRAAEPGYTSDRKLWADVELEQSDQRESEE